MDRTYELVLPHAKRSKFGVRAVRCSRGVRASERAALREPRRVKTSTNRLCTLFSRNTASLGSGPTATRRSTPPIECISRRGIVNTAQRPFGWNFSDAVVVVSVCALGRPSGNDSLEIRRAAIGNCDDSFHVTLERVLVFIERGCVGPVDETRPTNVNGERGVSCCYLRGVPARIQADERGSVDTVVVVVVVVVARSSSIDDRINTEHREFSRVVSTL